MVLLYLHFKATYSHYWILQITSNNHSASEEKEPETLFFSTVMKMSRGESLNALIEQGLEVLC